MAIVLHPTVRVHFLLFLAGIRERIGYDRKAPYFLTQIIKHHKHEGLKHELEYNFDLLKPLGIDTVERQLHMPIKPDSERIVSELLTDSGIKSTDTLIAVNPSASCISKRWPLTRFAEVIDNLARALYGVKVLIVADEVHGPLADELIGMTKTMPLDFSGKFDLSGLASLFKRCSLVISNDSGPVHLAVAVGTPVISIFGRNQPGLSPRRWGPTGPLDVFLHEKTECSPCLAHACVKGFGCLEAVTVEEVVGHALKILEKRKEASQTTNAAF